MKKRLLIVTDILFPFTGITKVLLEVIPRLKSFEIVVMYPEKEKRLGIKGVKEVVVRYNYRVIGLPIIKLSERKKIENEVRKSDLVWVQFIGPLSMAAIDYAKKYKNKITAFLHLFEEEVFSANIVAPLRPLKPIVKNVAIKYYNKCDLIVVPSKNIGQEIKKRGIKVKQKVVNLGVSIESEGLKKEKVREQLGIPKNSFVIVYVGRLSKEKYYDTLINAYKEFKKENEGAFLLLVGYGKGREIRNIKKIKDIKITGYVKDIAPYLIASDVFVLPSITETTSLATLEAMYVGLPVIVTRVGFVSRYVKDRKAGLFFEKKNAYDLYEKIKILANDNALRTTLGKNAKLIARRFYWGKTASELEKVFLRLAK